MTNYCNLRNQSYFYDSYLDPNNFLLVLAFHVTEDNGDTALYAGTINDLLGNVYRIGEIERDQLDPDRIEKGLRSLAKSKLVSLNDVLEKLGIMQLIDLDEEQRLVGAPLYLLLREEPLARFFPDYKERKSLLKSWKQRNREAFNKAREKRRELKKQRRAARKTK